MVYSENYNFALPEDEDNYDISPLSENFETLDGILSENESAVGEINNKIGTPAENGQTLFSLLGQNKSTGLTSIKSIQRVVYTLHKNNSTENVSIQPVTPANCIGLLELLYCSYDATPKTLYTIHENHVTFEFFPNASQTTIVGLWIIEFC